MGNDGPVSEDAKEWKEVIANKETIETLLAQAKDRNPAGFTVYENGDPSQDVVCYNHVVRKFPLFDENGMFLDPDNRAADNKKRNWKSVTCDICQKNVYADFKSGDFPEFAVYSCPCCKYWVQEPLEQH